MTAPITTRERVELFLQSLAKASTIGSIYGAQHRLSQSHIDDVELSLTSLLSERPELNIGIIGKELVFEKKPFIELSIQKQKFVQKIIDLGMSRIVFKSGILKQELTAFVELLSTKIQPDLSTEELQNILTVKHVSHISVCNVGKDDIKPGVPDKKQILSFAKEKYISSLNFLHETVEDVREGNPLNVNSLRQVTSGLINSMLLNKDLLLMLATVKIHDADTLVHNVNTSIFTLTQAEMLGIGKKYLGEIATITLTHNLGDLVFSKSENGRSPGDETTEMSAILDSIKLLMKMEHCPPLAAVAAYEHRIPYNGTGILQKHYGEELNLISMMISISKHYDQARRYHYSNRNCGPENVHEEMTALSGKKFHPDLLSNFFVALGVYPPGTLVELDSGEIGIVIQSNIDNIRRPRLEVLYDTDGQKYEYPVIVNLTERNKSGTYNKSIVKSILSTEQIQIPDHYMN